MKAILFKSPKVLEIIDKEVPKYKEGHSILKTEAIGICGSDIHGFDGTQPMFSYPKIVGHEISAVIDSSDKFIPGQRVTVLPYLSCGECIACRSGKSNACTSLSVFGVHIDGGMQEYIQVPNQYIIPVKNLSPKQVAMVEPLSISEHAFSRGDVKPNDWIIVSGAGPIGMGIIVMAKYRKANVIVIDMNEKRLEFAKEFLHADHCLKPSDTLIDEVAAITNNDMPTTIYDATGNSSSMNGAVNLLAHGGTMVFVGLHNSNIDINDLQFHKRESTLKGSRAAFKKDFEAVIEMIESGYFDPELFVTTTFSTDSFMNDFESFTTDRTQIKGVVLF